MLVRCNWCMEIFEEETIPYDEDLQEYCPKCKEYGFLMDMGEEDG